tara:strand:+ start:3248 stop:3952 length:705 start_codon:yes stop_codon:yes gene_type:complete
MKMRANQMCQCILIFLAIFLIYQIVCNCNKKSLTGGNKDPSIENVVPESDTQEDSDTQIESDSELDFNDPDYYNYEPVVNDNVEAVMNDAVEKNTVEPIMDTSNDVVQQENMEEPQSVSTEEFNITGLEDADKYHLLGSNEVVANKNKKLNPNELLPADSKDMKGNNFLTATLSKSEQIIGVPTQTQRARKNYDLRSSPPNPQVEVSPWNMSTMEPDTGRLTFEIGQSNCAPCE